MTGARNGDDSMGHYVNFAVMEPSATPKEMNAWRYEEAEMNHDRFEGPLSLPDVEIVRGKILDGIKAAEDFLERRAMRDGLGYADAAVLFRDENLVRPTKTMKTLEERMERLRALREKTHDEALPSRRKGKRTTCPQCESALANAYLKGRDRCPVCGTSLLSKTATERIANIEARLRKCSDDIDTERIRMAKNAPTRWLVRVSCHC